MSLNVSVDIDHYELDLARYTKAIAGRMQDLWRGALGAFVKGTMGQIHIDTGMSAASMREIAGRARIWGAVENEIGLRQKNPKGRVGYGYDKSGYRSMKEGIALAKGATQIIIEYPVMEFNFNIEVWQWKRWEGDWQSLSAGRKAFDDYIKSNFKAMIPSLNDFMRKRKR